MLDRYRIDGKHCKDRVSSIKLFRKIYTIDSPKWSITHTSRAHIGELPISISCFQKIEWKIKIRCVAGQVVNCQFLKSALSCAKKGPFIVAPLCHPAILFNSGSGTRISQYKPVALVVKCLFSKNTFHRKSQNLYQKSTQKKIEKSIPQLQSNATEWA